MAPGSIDEVCQRVLLWGQREGGGLARVEYSSEFDRQRVVQRLQRELAQAGVAWTEIVLPTRREATDIVRFLRERLSQVPGGVVSVTGFATAFESKTPLADALRVVNFNREELVALPLRQLWWMTPVLLQTSLHAMPDLHGWFRPQLQLSPAVRERELSDTTIRSAVTPRLGSEQVRGVNFEDARQRSQNLLTEFFTARQAGAADQDLLMTYLLPALESLAEVGAQRELRDLTSQFEGFLGSLKLGKTTEMTTAVSRLARLYSDQGRYTEAEPLYVQALEIWKIELGDRHLYTATSLNNLALLYYSQARYAEAEPLYVQALEIWETELGDRHPCTAQGLNNLALLYYSQGRYTEAEPLYVQALEIYKTELGDRHPCTAQGLNNLAGLYCSQGRYAEAEPLYIQALEIRETELGDRHPDTAQGLNNLALLYYSQGRYAEAEPLHVQALEIKKTELGDRHPDTAGSLYNLAGLYHNTQQHQQALIHIQQALDIYVSTLGTNHPTTQAAMSWHELIQQAMDKLS
ncbi:MAG: tetratricopeptide repeat-containing protein [Phormidesmis priestleyi]|uniref:Tetratricopeptide repeat-containing protein n=1 Tax=Phormidesmis priestleyi TaxID=268141 RepID=A0A2W4YNC6_9CYAN|nr:MAG: tetratricopeptide repeat-containing protein [Phormidesmis priestleyi]